MDTIQLTIVIISFILTSLVVLLTYQVWHILKEIRKMLESANSMVDEVEGVARSLKSSVIGFSQVIAGAKTGLMLFDKFSKKGEKHGKK